MPFIIYPQADNKLAIIIPTGDVNDAIKDVPANTPYKIVNNLNIDDYFFDAYFFSETAPASNYIEHSLPIAHSIQMNHWRAARKAIFDELDVMYMKALELNDIDMQTFIASKKKELRDVTNTPLPDDLPGIKATWPTVLGART